MAVNYIRGPLGWLRSRSADAGECRWGEGVSRQRVVVGLNTGRVGLARWGMGFLVKTPRWWEGERGKLVPRPSGGHTSSKR